MLKKLLKYEFKATARTYGGMYLALLAASVLFIEDVEPVLDEAVFLKNGRIFAHRSVDELRETEGMSVDAYFREVFKC